jgi:hypothetical protein
LRDNYDKFQAHNVRIVTVTFVTGYWLDVWMKKTQSPFTMLLDKERRYYHQFAMKKRFVAVWQPKVLWFYAKRFLQGNRIQAIHGDPHQLGGDFIIARNGQLHFAYSSDDPTDRPSLATLLAVAQQVNTTKSSEL